MECERFQVFVVRQFWVNIMYRKIGQLQYAERPSFIHRAMYLLLSVHSRMKLKTETKANSTHIYNSDESICIDVLDVIIKNFIAFNLSMTLEKKFFFVAIGYN